MDLGARFFSHNGNCQRESYTHSGLRGVTSSTSHRAVLSVPRAKRGIEFSGEHVHSRESNPEWRRCICIQKRALYVVANSAPAGAILPYS